MREASQVCDMEQVNTFIMLRLYSLSKDQSELCDPHDKESILSEVKELTDKVSPFTFDQIMAALDFAQYGRNPQDCEKKGKSRKANEDEDDEEDAYLDEEYECVEIGMLKDGLVFHLGSLSELKGMTTSCLHLLLEYARQMEFGEANTKHTKNKKMIEYYCVLDEIKSAHKKDEMTEESNNG